MTIVRTDVLSRHEPQTGSQQEQQAGFAEAIYHPDAQFVPPSAAESEHGMDGRHRDDALDWHEAASDAVLLWPLVCLQRWLDSPVLHVAHRRHPMFVHLAASCGGYGRCEGSLSAAVRQRGA